VLYLIVGLRCARCGKAGIMRVLSTEEMKCLKESLSKMMAFLKRMEKHRKPHFSRYLEAMKNNIEIAERTEDKDMDKLSAVLYRDWAAANDRYTGIPDYDIFLKNTGKLKEDVLEFIYLSIEIGQYFS